MASYLVAGATSIDKLAKMAGFNTEFKTHMRTYAPL
jgi:hypothetical protein